MSAAPEPAEALSRQARFLKTAPLRLCAVAVFLGGFAFASNLVREDVVQLERFRVPLEKLRVTPPPSFLSSQALSDVGALPLPVGRFSAFEPRLVPTLAYALRRLPWVDQVSGLRLEYPNRLRFELSLLEPAALLELDGQVVAVSTRGRLFSRSYVGTDARRPVLPLIKGLSLQRDGQELLASTLALIARLRDRGLLRSVDIVAIDLSNHAGRKDAQGPEVVLLTRGGTLIDWGRVEDSGQLHISFARKAMKLVTFLSKGPPLERVARLALRWNETVYTLRAVTDASEVPGG